MYIYKYYKNQDDFLCVNKLKYVLQAALTSEFNNKYIDINILIIKKIIINTIYTDVKY
jgi:hypothetical protein